MTAADPAPPRTDRELLDTAAYGEVIARHGRLVFGVCRRVLRHDADAEDAFQATFITLFRKGGTFRHGDSVAGWLHTVAVRIALRARQRQAARFLLERDAAMTADAPVSVPEPQWVADLDAALAQLPAEVRLPLTLCYLQGKTGDEAAAELGCSRSTLTRRLTEGRELLRKRMGAAVTAVALLAILEGASAHEPPAAVVVAVTNQGASEAAVALANDLPAPVNHAFNRWLLVLLA